MGWTASGYNTMKGGGWNCSLDVSQKKKTFQAKGRKIPLKISDEQVLEMRRLHEFEGKKCNEIRALFPELEMDYGRCYGILSYLTRCKLIPKQK